MGTGMGGALGRAWAALADGRGPEVEAALCSAEAVRAGPEAELCPARAAQDGPAASRGGTRVRSGTCTCTQATHSSSVQGIKALQLIVMEV